MEVLIRVSFRQATILKSIEGRISLFKVKPMLRKVIRLIISLALNRAE